MDQTIQDMLSLYGVTPATEHFLLSEQRMYIDGKFVEARDKGTIDVVEPATAVI